MTDILVDDHITTRDFTRIIRTDSFWDGTLYQQHGTQILDNHGNLIASFRSFEVEPEARWCPVLTHHDEDRFRAVNLNDRSYYFYNIVDTVYRWKTMGYIESKHLHGICRLISLIVHHGVTLTWNLDYFFPGYYFPARCNGLMPCNIQGFLSQFPSDPYVIDLTVDDSETISDISGMECLDDLVFEDWEHFFDYDCGCD